MTLPFTVLIVDKIFTKVSSDKLSLDLRFPEYLMLKKIWHLCSALSYRTEFDSKSHGLTLNDGNQCDRRTEPRTIETGDERAYH
jgi:hypothetical protein